MEWITDVMSWIVHDIVIARVSKLLLKIYNGYVPKDRTETIPNRTVPTVARTDYLAAW